MKNDSGQVSVELMLLIALVLIIFIPAFILISRAGLDTTEQISGEQVKALARSILDEARETYYLGEGSRQRITLDVADQVESMMIVKSGPVGDEVYELAMLYNQNDVTNLISSVSEVPIRINTTQSVTCDPEPTCGTLSCDCESIDLNLLGVGARDIELRTQSDGELYVEITFR